MGLHDADLRKYRVIPGVAIIHHTTQLTVLKSYIARSDPSLTSTSAMQRGEWIDALSRSGLIASLLLDERPGYLSQMVEATYPGFNPGGQPPMSDEIIDAAEDLQRAAREGAVEFDWVPDVPNAIGL